MPMMTARPISARAARGGERDAATEADACARSGSVDALARRGGWSSHSWSGGSGGGRSWPLDPIGSSDPHRWHSRPAIASTRWSRARAGDRDRTDDLRFTKPLLCRLSYSGDGARLLGVHARRRRAIA